ncbi:hypothetical protein V2G26_019938 [Clonostachys chloroleuca]
MSTTTTHSEEATACENDTELQAVELHRNSNNLRHDILVRRVYKDGTGQFCCENFPVDSSNQGEDVFVKPMKMRTTSGWSSFSIAFIDAALMRRDSAWIVSVSALSRSGSNMVDLEAEAGSRRFYVSKSEYSEALMKAFYNPQLLHTANDFLVSNYADLIQAHNALSVEP